jgi:hypothetical protein
MSLAALRLHVTRLSWVCLGRHPADGLELPHLYGIHGGARFPRTAAIALAADHGALCIRLRFAALAVMHIGYRSLADLVFVFTVGLYFAFVVQWSGSILGVSLAHGVTNTTLFVVMPDLMQHGSIQSRVVLGLAVLWGTILAGISTIHFNISWRATELRRLRGRLPQRCDAPTVILHDQQIPI